MKTSLRWLVLWCTFLCRGNCGTAYAQMQTADGWIDSTFNRMTTDEKIGQLFMIAAYSNQTEKYEANLEKLISQYHIGGIIFFQGTPARQVQLTNRFQKSSKYPLLIGTDAEHGIGWRLTSAMEFPKMGTIGAVRNDSLVFVLGAAIARHCREIGVHVNFAPVADINSNPSNPVIGIRSFGERPEEVAQKAILYLKGSLSQNVLPVVKHFPGHGDTDTDSHHTLPFISRSRSRLDSVELYPYRTMIEADVPAIMVSHLNVPALDSAGMPATLSPAIVNGLLKRELHFRGLCITDAMNMKGVTQSATPGEAEVKALLAGNDLLLFPADPGKAIQAVRKAVKDSLLPETLIDEKCKKILAVKATYARCNLFPSGNPDLQSRLNSPEDLSLKQELYKEAVTLIKNTDSLLPLKRLDTLRIASLNFGSDRLAPFQTMLGKYTAVTHFAVKRILSPKELEEWEKKLRSYNCIILYNQTAGNSPGKHFGFNPSLHSLLSRLGKKKLILCHPAIPYGAEAYLDLPIDAILISYENQPDAQQYAAQGIFGGIAIRGQLPVSISPSFPAGSGILTPKTRLGYGTPENCGIPSEKLSAIDSLCRAAITSKATPGCQVLVARNGTVIYNKAFGHHTYEKKEANTTNDIYDIASVTKITATLPAIMKLYDNGQLKLERPLSAYYSALADTDKKNMTVLEVLCHNAGLKASLPLLADAIDKTSLPGPLFTTRRTQYNTLRLNNRLYANVNYRFKEHTVSNTPLPHYKYLMPGLYIHPAYRDSIRRSILSAPLNPRKNYVYSDLGFMLLKNAVEEVSGESISRYCKEAFFHRLGMYSTDFRAAERLPKSRIIPSCRDRLYRKTEIRGYVHDPAAAVLGGVAGHAGLFSTAEDLAKILQMYLNKGKYGDECYLSQATVDTFTQRNTVFPRNRRGLGFDKPETDRTKSSPVCSAAPPSSFGHTGFTGILVWCDPDNELIYIFLSNRTYPDESNTKLSEKNIRTKIQEVIYKAIEP